MEPGAGHTDLSVEKIKGGGGGGGGGAKDGGKWMIQRIKKERGRQETLH